MTFPALPFRLLALLIALCALAGGVSAVNAAAAGVSRPVADCQSHGRLTRHYSASELRNAIATMPADISEYTNCPDVIRSALLADLHLKGPASGDGGGSFLPAWVIAILVVLVLTGAGAGAVAMRNRRGAP
jgi:hypothetical protein